MVHIVTVRENSRPLWGKVAGLAPDGRGELACYLDCVATSPPTNATAFIERHST